MNKGWIDSASLSQVVEFFDKDYNKENPYDWSYRTAVDLTILLIITNHQCLAPSLSSGGSIEDNQSRLYSLLTEENIVQPLELKSQSSLVRAKQSTRSWAQHPSTIEKLKVAVDGLIHDDDNFKEWIDWIVSGEAWKSHALRHSGLIDNSYQRYVQKVLGKTDKEMVDYVKMTSDCDYLDLLARKRDSEFDEVCKGYMCAALIRGRFHLKAALENEYQITPHPFRELIFPEKTKAAITELVTNTNEYLAKLVIYGAAQQSTLQKRLAAWVENIRLARKSYIRAPGRLSHINNLEIVANEAYRFAKDSNLIMGKQRIISLIDTLISVASGSLVAVTLDPIAGPLVGSSAGIAVGGLLSTATNIKKISEKGARLVWFHLEGRKLKQAGAGLVRREWKK